MLSPWDMSSVWNWWGSMQLDPHDHTLVKLSLMKNVEKLRKKYHNTIDSVD